MSAKCPSQATKKKSSFRVRFETQLSCFGPQKMGPFQENCYSLEIKTGDKLWNYLYVAICSCNFPRNTVAPTFHLSQELLCPTLLSAMDLAFFLAVWQLVETWLPSHFLQSVHCVSSKTNQCVLSECVDVHFNQHLVDSAIIRFQWIWVCVP